MPVVEHEVHALTRIVGTEPYSCRDRQHRPYYRHVDAHGKGSWISHRMSSECRYDKSLSDLRCAGCAHCGSGERYAEMVRRDGK
jgi:hypothetical protein